MPFLISDPKLTLVTSFGWYILFVLLAALFAYLIYRYTLPPVSVLRKTILWTLRGIALLLILFLLFEPIFSFTSNHDEKPAIAVLIDKSASMSVKDKLKSRDGEIQNFLNSGKFSSVVKNTEVKYFAFSDSASEVNRDSLSRIKFDGVGTDISEAWSYSNKLLAEKNLQAVILLSDGGHNIGANPVRLAAESSIPIYALGVGDTTRSVDAAISELLTNEITYVGNKVPISITVKARGLKGKTTQLHLYGRNGKEEGKQELRFESDESEITSNLIFNADVVGEMRVRAYIDPIAGEVSTDNNSRSVIVKVLEAKSKVLLFSGPPSADLTALRQTLEADTSISINSYVEAIGGKLLEDKSLPTENELEKANLLIFVNYPSKSSSDGFVNKILKTAKDKKTPVLFFTGPGLLQSKFSLFNDLFPFKMSKSNLTEGAVNLRSSSNHPALTEKSPLPLEWSSLPPVFGGVGNFAISPSTQVAVKLSRESLGIAEDEPALIFWEKSRQRGAAFLCWGTYKWKFGTASGAEGINFYDQLISRIKSWLIAPSDEQRVKIVTSKKIYSGTEKVRFTAQVYGSDFSPRDDAFIDLKVSSDERTETVPLKNRGNGRYEGELNPWGEGEYKFFGSATANQDTIGKDKGLFAVEAFNPELIDTRARFDLLQQIAYASKGKFAPIEAADSILNNLKLTPKKIEKRSEISLWNKAMMLWIIIGLLSAEWIIRKRNGML